MEGEVLANWSNVGFQVIISLRVANDQANMVTRLTIEEKAIVERIRRERFDGVGANLGYIMNVIRFLLFFFLRVCDTQRG